MTSRLTDMQRYFVMDRRIIPPIPNFVALQRENLWTVVSFLQQNGLTARHLASSLSDITDTFQLMTTDLTEEGLEFYYAANAAAFPSVAKGDDRDFKKVRDSKRLTKALDKFRNTTDASSLTSATQTQGPSNGLSSTQHQSGEKYDDAKWHSEGNFPTDLKSEAAGTHTGMYMAWALQNGLGDSEFVRSFAKQIDQLRNRATTPGQFFLKTCGGKFTDETLSDEGNQFTRAYFPFTDGAYLGDYEKALASKLPTLYHAADTWASFDALAPLIDKRFKEWKRNGN
jgi:hypothetical protein